MGEMMRRSSVAAAAVLVLAACGGDAGDQAPADGPGTDTSAATQPVTPSQPTTGGASVALPEGVTQAMVAQGEQIFNQQICFTCHGQNGVGTPLGPAMNDQEWLNVDGSYEQIVEVIRTGVPQPVQYDAAMPPMGGLQLTEDQIRAAAAYVYSLSRGG